MLNKKWKVGIGFLVVIGLLVAQQPVAQGPQASNAAAWLTNVSQWAGSALGSPSNYGTSPGAVAVPGVNAFVTNAITATATITPSSSSTVAFSPFDLAATAATNVDASPGNVYGFYGYNPNVTTCFLQFYNTASASLGTSALHPFGVLAGGSFTITPGAMALYNFSTAISTGQTTTATGATPCSSAMNVTILYK